MHYRLSSPTPLRIVLCGPVFVATARNIFEEEKKKISCVDNEIRKLWGKKKKSDNFRNAKFFRYAFYNNTCAAVGIRSTTIKYFAE